MSFRFDREKTRKNIGLILDDIKTRADPRLLDEYRRAFKREVSFFRRSWAAAYLLMLYDQDGLRGNAPGQGRRPSLRRKPADPAGRAEEARQARPPIEALPEEEARQLFINIGRSRRVFPREILGLIYSKASVSREDIGSIRIMDNYSFIQARDSVADTIIEALNGKSFRGKVLTVNYARPRREEGDDDAESQAGSRAENGENGSFPAEDAGGFETLAGDSEQGDDHPDEEGV
ncbi:MAG: DbpA RNA binding domain-containing protein [Treponema sp.]|jgi:hypothetical protein|nr:DbpA RNA binding domain-containing protein [Treponema sp.]